MNDKNIPKKILYWYDNNKRFLPWRKKVSKKKREYYTLTKIIDFEKIIVQTKVYGGGIAKEELSNISNEKKCLYAKQI